MNADGRYEFLRKVRDLREDLEQMDDQLSAHDLHEESDKIRDAFDKLGEIKL